MHKLIVRIEYWRWLDAVKNISIMQAMGDINSSEKKKC